MVAMINKIWKVDEKINNSFWSWESRVISFIFLKVNSNVFLFFMLHCVMPRSSSVRRRVFPLSKYHVDLRICFFMFLH